MSIQIDKDSIIYIVAPANVATGGPELLHQLAFHLRVDLMIKTYMYYIPNDHPTPVHDMYKKYGNPYIKEPNDNKKNILIVPEVYRGIAIFGKFKNLQKVIWWLSIDNFYTSFLHQNIFNSLSLRVINRIKKSVGLGPLDLNELALRKYKKYDLKQNIYIKQAFFHLVQSEYARQHLQKKGIKTTKYLSDYLNEAFLEIETDISKKENIVVYNPIKGSKYTKKIIDSGRKVSIKFVPIENMTRNEVIRLLQRAKVYIDFGNHPGKDRIPREAAILKCCVITGLRGSAKYKEDVNIPFDYKFEDKKENISKVIGKIQEIFNNYEIKIGEFQGYVNKIKEEKNKFLKDVFFIFTV
jgi:hypothetical protein